MRPPETSNAGSVADSLSDSIIDLTRNLVRIPSRAGIDEYEPIFALLSDWLDARGIEHRVLTAAQGGPVAIVADVAGGPGPTYALDATVDTAGFGNEDAWSLPPTSAEIRDGWLYGRGSADSKAGAAIFCHVTAYWAEHADRLHGTLRLILDADEHTGEFGGIERALEAGEGAEPSGVMIGYPGAQSVAIGARGFERGVLTVHGIAAHSGSGSCRGVNAVHRAARLVARLSGAELPNDPRADFPLPPKLTVTGIQGGGGYSEVPDRCEVQLDIRLTPSFQREQARTHVARLAGALDAEAGDGVPHTEVSWHGGWPAYRLGPGSPVARALTEAARQVVGPEVEEVVVGPSNVANMLFQRGIEATCGFGVAYHDLHGTDERFDVSTVGPTYEVYRLAINKLLGKS